MLPAGLIALSALSFCAVTTDGAPANPRPEIEILSPVLAADAPVLRLRCVGAPLVEGDATDVGVRVVGRWFSVGTLAPGAEARVDLDGTVLAAPEGFHTPVPLELHYTPGGVEYVVRSVLVLAREPESAVPPGAIAKVVGHNLGLTAEDDAYISAFVPGMDASPRSLCVRTAGSDLVPSLIEPADGGVFVHALVDIPADYARCLYLCSGHETTPPCDLTVESDDLGTGAGRVRVATAHYSLTLSEAAGASVTEFLSKTTRLDYAARSVGDQPGLLRVETGATGSVAARVAALGFQGNVRVERTYTFVAGKPWFLVRCRVEEGEAHTDEVRLVEAGLQSDVLSEIASVGRATGNGRSGVRSASAPSVHSFLEGSGRRTGEGWRTVEQPRPGPESCVQVPLPTDPAQAHAGEASASAVVLLYAGSLEAARDSARPLCAPRFVTTRLIPQEATLQETAHDG